MLGLSSLIKKAFPLPGGSSSPTLNKQIASELWPACLGLHCQHTSTFEFEPCCKISNDFTGMHSYNYDFRHIGKQLFCLHQPGLVFTEMPKC